MIDVPCKVLQDMLDTKTVVTAEGERIPLRAHVFPYLAEALYRTVKSEKPTTVVEVGLANAASSLAILTALAELGGDRKLISVDPKQTSEWKGAGVRHIEMAGFSHLHELVEDFDYLALPRLLERGVRPTFSYIDGWHTFDYTLLDFFYLDKMTPAGGVVAFNDCGQRPVHRAIKCAMAHRRYEELPVLPKEYSRRGFPYNIPRMFTGRLDNDRYFRKSEDWEPGWNFHAKF